MANNNYQVVLDFLVNLKSNPGQLAKITAEIQNAMNGITPEIDISGMESQFQELSDALSGIDPSSLNDLSSAFENMDAETFIAAITDAAASLDELTAQAEQAAAEGAAALAEMASAGQQDTEAYRELEAELLKTTALLNNLYTASGNPLPAPHIDPEKAKKEGENVGDKLGEGVKKKFSSMDFGSMFNGVLAVFGGNALTGGVNGLLGSFSGLLEAGKKNHEMNEKLEASFLAQGTAAEMTAGAIDDVNKRSKAMSNDLAVSNEKINALMSEAIALGGATGDRADDLVKLSLAIEEASGGMISADAAMKPFMRGLDDPEAQANLGRLKMQFPALATALKDVKEPAELTRVALEKLKPVIKDMEGDAEGPIGSMTRLENSFTEIKQKLGRGLLEALAPAMEMAGEVLVPLLLSVGSTLGQISGFVKTYGSELKVAGVAAGVFAGSMWLANGGLTSLGSSVASTAKNLLTKLVPSMFAQTAATEGAAVAQGKLNLAFLSNPIFLTIAAIAAVVIGLHELTSAYTESAEEKMKDAEAQDALINKQIEAKDKEIELAQTKSDLVQQFKEGGKASQENADLMVKLAEAYPGVINASKSYEENLNALSQASLKTNEQLNNLTGELNSLSTKKLDLQMKIASLKVDVEKQKIEDQITQALGGLDVKWQEFLFSTSDNRKAAEAMIKPFTDSIYNAKDSKELEKASLDFQLAIFNGKEFERLSETEKIKMLEGVQGMVEARKSAMENANQNVGKDFDVLKAQGRDTGKIIEFLANKYKVSKEEVKRLVDEQDKAKKKVEETKNAVDKLAEAFGKAVAESKKKQTEAVGALAQAYADLKDARDSGDYAKIVNAENNLKSVRLDTHKTYKEGKETEKKLTDAEILSKKELGVKDKEKTKDAKSLEDTLKKQLETEKKKIASDLESLEIEQKLSILMQDRERNTFDDIVAQNAKNTAVQTELDKIQQIYKITKNSEGKLEFGVKIKSDAQEEVLGSITELNNKLRAGDVASIELKAKLSKDQTELDKSIADFKRQQLEFDISIGIKNQDDLIQILNIELADIEAQIESKRFDLGMFDPVLDAAQIADANKKIVDLENQRLTKFKDIQTQEKAIYDEKLQTIKDNEAEAVKIIEETYAVQEEQLKDFTAKWESLQNKKAEKDKKGTLDGIASEEKKKLDELEKWQKAGIISAEDFEKKKADLEKESQSRREKAEEDSRRRQQIAEAQKHGIEIQLQMVKDKETLSIQKTGVEDQLKLLKEKATKFDAAGKPIFDVKEDQKAYDALSKQLTETYRMLAEKGSLIEITAKELQTSVTDTITALFSGDKEAIEDTWRQFFAVMVGVLRKEASAFILGLILSKGTLEYLAALPFPANVLSVPLITGAVYGAVNAVTNPILAELQSFASGGRIDEPTMAIVGDAATLGGRNREWIFNDAQLIATVQMAATGSNAILAARLASIERLLASQEITAKILGSDIELSQKRTAIKRQARSF